MYEKCNQEFMMEKYTIHIELFPLMIFQMVKCKVFTESKIKGKRESESKTGMEREAGLI